MMQRTVSWIKLFPLVSLLGVVGSGTEREAPVSLEETERKLVLAVQGEAVSVKASPALCSQGKQAAESRVRGTDWYFSEEGCVLRYPPSAAAIVTTATLGLSKRLDESPELTARVNALLDELRAQVARTQLTPARKLRIHTTAWEIAVGLERGLAHHPERAPALRPTLCKSFGLLDDTRFSKEEAQALPATLASLPKLAQAPNLDRPVAALIRRDPGLVEVFRPTDAHAEALFGRFTPRVFLTVEDESQRPKLREFLAHASDDELTNLPQFFDGIQGILILYFNVITEANVILPTELVAFWQEYSFGERTSFSLPFVEAARLIDFTTVSYERGGGIPGQEYVYRQLDPNGMALRGFIDAKPAIDGMSATTLRGNCLHCHLYRVETFNTHARRKVEFLAPFERSGSDLLTSFVINDMTSILREGRNRCGPVGSVAVPSKERVTTPP